MACNITLAGLALDCKDTGGIKEVYIADRNNISTLTLSATTQVITGITMSGSTKWYRYSMNAQTGNLSSKITNSTENNTSYVESTLNLVFAKMSATKRIELESLRLGELAVIVRDNNDVYWYLGYDYAVEMLDATVQTGTAFGDLNGYNINLIDRSFKLPYSVLSTIIAGLL